jgi:hypothetical protein
MNLDEEAVKLKEKIATNKENDERQIKRLRRDIEGHYKIIKKGTAPKIAVAHLEKIIIGYKSIYKIKKPTLSDRTGFAMLMTQYKTLCVLSGSKAQNFKDIEELKKVE